jgi:hypothetical protein
VPKDRKFVNPLTMRSDASANTDTDTSTSTETLPDTYTSTLKQPAKRKRGAQAFERTHERITLWLDKGLKQRFEALADEQGVAKAALLDEAIADLLKKHRI